MMLRISKSCHGMKKSLVRGAMTVNSLSSNRDLAVSADTELSRSFRIHSSHPPWGEAPAGNPCSRRSTDRHRRAFVLFPDARNVGKSAPSTVPWRHDSEHGAHTRIAKRSHDIRHAHSVAIFTTLQIVPEQQCLHAPDRFGQRHESGSSTLLSTRSKA